MTEWAAESTGLPTHMVDKTKIFDLFIDVQWLIAQERAPDALQNLFAFKKQTFDSLYKVASFSSMNSVVHLVDNLSLSSLPPEKEKWKSDRSSTPSY